MRDHIKSRHPPYSPDVTPPAPQYTEAERYFKFLFSLRREMPRSVLAIKVDIALLIVALFIPNE